MKRTTFALTAITGVALLSAHALAVEPTLPRNPKVFGKLDTDSDGKITPQELKPKAERRLLRLDADNNHEVTAAEIDAYLQKRLEQRREQILRRMDGDKNGVITVLELDRLVDEIFNSADTDKDGGISLAEARDFTTAKLHRAASQTKAN